MLWQPFDVSTQAGPQSLKLLLEEVCLHMVTCSLLAGLQVLMSLTPWASTRSSPALPVWWHHSTVTPPTTVSAPGCRSTGLRSFRWVGAAFCGSSSCPGHACQCHSKRQAHSASSWGRHQDLFLFPGECAPPEPSGAATAVPECLPLLGLYSAACTQRRSTLPCVARGSCIQPGADRAAQSASEVLVDGLPALT